jgi:carbon storage regulator CsrA
MLVLSRRPSDKICFPDLGISVEVLRVAGNNVRLGIQAPKDVRVLRHELAEGFEAPVAAAKKTNAKLSHDMRNRLNTATLALHLTQQQLKMGRVEDAQTTLEKAFCEFQALDKELGNVPSQTKPDADEKRRVLLVEDDTNERELLSGILRMNGFTVDTAEDGVAAINYLNNHEMPDGVLMDMRMPRLDGPKTISAIRRTATYNHLKLFAVSATDPNELGVSTGAEGIDRWFSKPLNPTSLVDELNRELTAHWN